MRKFFLPILFLIVSFTNGFAQEIISNEPPLVVPKFPVYDPSFEVPTPEITAYLAVNKTQQIELESLYDPNLTLRSAARLYFNSEQDSVHNDISSNYARNCKRNEYKIVDSIDVTGDGIKELFIYREALYLVSYYKSGPYGEGNQVHTYGSYEVWNCKTKKRIFELLNYKDSQVAITTNVVRNYGYRLDVSIDKKGVLEVSGNPVNCAISVGKYTYNSSKMTYQLVKF